MSWPGPAVRLIDVEATNLTVVVLFAAARLFSQTLAVVPSSRKTPQGLSLVPMRGLLMAAWRSTSGGGGHERWIHVTRKPAFPTDLSGRADVTPVPQGLHISLCQLPARHAPDTRVPCLVPLGSSAGGRTWRSGLRAVGGDPRIPSARAHVLRRR